SLADAADSIPDPVATAGNVLLAAAQEPAPTSVPLAPHASLSDAVRSFPGSITTADNVPLAAAQRTDLVARPATDDDPTLAALFGAAPTLASRLRGNSAEIGSAKSAGRTDILDLDVRSLPSYRQDSAAVAAVPFRAGEIDTPARVVVDRNANPGVGTTASAQL